MAYEITRCNAQKFRTVIGIFERGSWHQVNDSHYLAHFTAPRAEIFFDHKYTIYLRAVPNTPRVDRFASLLAKVAMGQLQTIDDKLLSIHG